MQYFGTIFLHRRMQMISIDILVPGSSDINTSHRKQLLKHGGKLHEFTTWSANLQNIVVVCHLF